MKRERVIKKVTRERSLRKIALVLLLFLLAFMGLIFVVSAFQEFTSEFTINLNYKDNKEGFSLYDNKGFNSPTPRLKAEVIRSLTNTTYDDLDLKLLDDIDGSHHGVTNTLHTEYFAYTFYIKNSGTLNQTYESRINLLNAAKNAESAVRLLIIYDSTTYDTPTNERKHTVYARERVDGGLENFADQSFLDSNAGTIIFMSRSLEPGQSHKYTIIMYLEGEDPECTDDIQGGMLKLNMEFLMV